MITAAEIVAAARAYKGTPFRHQGRRVAPGQATGLDCLGLWVAALTDCGIAVDDPCDYGRRPDLRRLSRETDAQAIRLPRTAPLEAGLFTLFHDPHWLHVGIMTGPESFIHARGPEEIGPGVIEHILDLQSWRPRLIAAWRHPEMIWPG